MVDLTIQEQNALAELSSVLRGWLYRYLTTHEVRDVNDSLLEIVDKYQLTPQSFDKLYDKFHRTGLNSR